MEVTFGREILNSAVVVSNSAIFYGNASTAFELSYMFSYYGEFISPLLERSST